MLIHCTRKLAQKLPHVSSTPQEETSILGSWHAHIFTVDRRNCVLFIHDQTRYGLFMAGLTKPSFLHLDTLFKRLFIDTLALQGIGDSILHQVNLCMGPVQYDMATDRSVLATINQAKQGVTAAVYAHYDNVMQINPPLFSHRLNMRPVTVRKQLIFPNEAMQAHLHNLFGK